jgi:8-oxo-dGTP pyrophosphatase MutT (NUDIX family)
VEKILMDRVRLLQHLRSHWPFDAHEDKMLSRTAEFVESNELFYARALAQGHVTGSAWIIDEGREHALLVHHGRLDLWVQPGGHVEDDADMLSTAWREAREETGLTDVRPVAENIFDVDVHEIPANKREARHLHYDIRFLFIADRAAPLVVSSESKALAWVPLARISGVTREESIRRMVLKVTTSGVLA